MAYVVTALWHAKPDKADRVAAVVDDLARTSREEPGCVQFQPNRHAEAPVRFLHADSEPFKRLVLGEALPDPLEDRGRLFWRSVGEA